jgi:hypothetical protein
MRRRRRRSSLMDAGAAYCPKRRKRMMGATRSRSAILQVRSRASCSFIDIAFL